MEIDKKTSFAFCLDDRKTMEKDGNLDRFRGPYVHNFFLSLFAPLFGINWNLEVDKKEVIFFSFFNHIFYINISVIKENINIHVIIF